MELVYNGTEHGNWNQREGLFLFYMNGFLHGIDGNIQNQTFQWFELV